MQELAQGWKILTAGDVFEHRDSYIVYLNDVEYHTLLMKTVNESTAKIIANGNRLVLLFSDEDYISDTEENDLGRLMHYADEYLINSHWKECHEQGNFIDTYEMINIDECKAAELIEKIREDQEKAAQEIGEAKIVRDLTDIRIDIKSLIDSVSALESSMRKSTIL